MKINYIFIILNRFPDGIHKIPRGMNMFKCMPAGNGIGFQITMLLGIKFPDEPHIRIFLAPAGNIGRIDADTPVITQFADQVYEVSLPTTDLDNFFSFNIILVNEFLVIPVINFTNVGENPCWSSYPFV